MHMDLSQLRAARNGLPTEHQATSKIATFAVIPAAMVGFLAGTQLVGLADPIGRLAWVCTARASVASFGTVCLVLGRLPPVWLPLPRRARRRTRRWIPRPRVRGGVRPVARMAQACPASALAVAAALNPPRRRRLSTDPDSDWKETSPRR